MPSADARWLLGELAGGGALRVRCGGGDHVSPDGKRWSRDRFFTSGATYLEGRRTFNGEIAGTADAALYRTERHFPPSRGEASGYRIPLPPGEYRVTLHFAEVYFQRPGARVFDVSIEGRRVLEGFEPLAAGFAAAVVKSFEVEAVDGLLVVELEGRTGEPKLSALEIEPGSGG
jgi:hypothetical protein